MLVGYRCVKGGGTVWEAAREELWQGERFKASHEWMPVCRIGLVLYTDGARLDHKEESLPNELISPTAMPCQRPVFHARSLRLKRDGIFEKRCTN